jgi:ABC-type nitrate/sulfonate/bicarbonate transport system substrate-binding protein
MHFFRAVILVFALLSSAAMAQTKITVAHTSVPDFAAAFIAKERGFFAKPGLDVRLQLITLTTAAK